MTQLEKVIEESECKGWLYEHGMLYNLCESLEQQNTALQARIKELEEPKTCDGCIYANESLDECQIIEYTDEHCIRWSNKDFYEQKQN